MRIYIKAKPKSKKEFIKKIDDLHYIVSVKDPPVGGKANQAIIIALAKYFNKPASQIYITSGEKSKHKIVEIPVTSDVESPASQKAKFGSVHLSG